MRSESMWTAVCIGAVSAIAAGMIELLLSLFFKFGAADPILGAAKTAILLAAIPEETTKFVFCSRSPKSTLAACKTS